MKDRHKALKEMKPDVPNCRVNGHYNVTQYQGILYIRLGSHLEGFPEDTQRRFNVYKTSIRRRRRRIDILYVVCLLNCNKKRIRYGCFPVKFPIFFSEGRTIILETYNP